MAEPRETSSSTLRRIAVAVATGAAAGAVAGVPMGVVAQAVHVGGDVHRRIPFSRTMRGIERRLGVLPFIDEPRHQTLTWIAHTGYSASAGAAFGALTTALPPSTKTPTAMTAIGTVFGLAVWGASYLGWLPTLRVLPSAVDDDPRFNVMNVIGHAAFGAALGITTAKLQQRRR